MRQLIIVDDEPKIRAGLRDYFPWHELGFEIAGDFGDGAQALEWVRQHPTDAVLTDIRMPVMDGLELCRQLHSLAQPPQVILLSSYTDFSYCRQALQFGAFDYIRKPTKYAELVEVFSRLNREAFADSEEPAAVDESYYDSLIRQAKDYIRQQLPAATLETVAHQVGLSPNYFSKLFKKCTGDNFSAYLNSVRMQEAARMLLQTQMHTYEISLAVGYYNAKNFTRAFKAYFGVIPREYRAKKRGGAP